MTEEQAGPDAGPRLVEIRDEGPGRAFALPSGTVIVGRGAEVTVQIDHEDISRRHAQLEVGPANVLVSDLGSKNGVFVDGQRIQAPTPVVHGARIGLGNLELELVHPPSLVRTALAEAGETTVTHTRRDESTEAPVATSLVLPAIGVLIFAGLLAMMLL